MDELEHDRLRLSEDSFRNLAEGSIQGIYVHDESGRPLYVNPAFSRMLGYDAPADILALDHSGHPLVAPHDRERLASYSEARLAGEDAPAEYEFDALTRDGALRRLRALVTDTRWQGQRAILATLLDVTGEYRAEARFRTLVEGSLHGIAIVSTDRRPLFVNRAYAELFGFADPSEVLALADLTELTHEADRERQRGYGRARARGEEDVPQLYEVVGVRRDGTELPLLASSRTVHWDGAPAFQVTVTDVSELKAAERALAETTRILQLVLDTIPNRVFWKDTEGRFLGCNRRLVVDLGVRDTSEIVGRTDYDFVTEAEASAFRADDAEVRETGVAKLGYEEPQTRPDGTRSWLRTSKVPLRDESGEIIGVLGAYEDITEQMRAREALRASEERYALAVRGSTDGIWDWDVRAGSIFFSDRLREILAFARRRRYVEPREVLGLIHPDDRTPYRTQIVRHLRGETDVFRLEFRVIGDDGTVRWILDRGVAVRDESGRAYRMAGSVVDITDRRRSEDELARYRSRLEEVVATRTEELHSTQASLLRAERLATLGELTAAVSHELRNPLGTIHTSVETLRRGIEEPDGPSQRALDRVERSIKRCVQVIDELLAYARIGAPVSTAVDLDDWLDESLAYSATARALSLERRGGSDARVSIDAEQLAGALENVLRNAAQAVDGSGNPAEDSGVRVETRRRGPRAEIRVSDAGNGIERSVRERVFEPLFSTRNFGVGLGLPMSRQVLEQHGGGVEIEETGPGGTTVLLWLPVSPE